MDSISFYGFQIIEGIIDFIIKTILEEEDGIYFYFNSNGLLL